MILLILGVYIIGVIITYIITMKRANYILTKCYSKDDETYEYTGAIIFAMLSFIGLFLFLGIRCVNIFFGGIDKIFKLK